MSIAIIRKIKIEQAKNLRCMSCGALLGKYNDLHKGDIEILCKRCKLKNLFRFS